MQNYAQIDNIDHYSLHNIFILTYGMSDSQQFPFNFCLIIDD